MTTKTATPALGRVLPGELRYENGCLVAEVEGRVATAVLPPSARVRTDSKGGQAVIYGNREIAIGQPGRISGGGEVTSSHLATRLPATCPSQLYLIGG